jgi:hypothetical protein
MGMRGHCICGVMLVKYANDAEADHVCHQQGEIVPGRSRLALASPGASVSKDGSSPHWYLGLKETRSNGAAN